MWLYFDKTGKLLEKLEHGNPARSGTADFEIFAYFEGLEGEDILPQAIIKLYKPDLNESSYAPILMDKKQDVEFVLMSGEQAQYFKNKEKYSGFYLDFSSFVANDDVFIALDTPGNWRAVITILSLKDRFFNVLGEVVFNVEPGVNYDKDQILPEEVYLNKIYFELSNLLNVFNIIGHPVGSTIQKDTVYTGENIILEDGNQGTQNGDIIPGGVVNGVQSYALGGTRYDYINEEENNFDRTPTSVDGNQSMAVGGSVHVNGDWSFAAGKDNVTYQALAFASGGANKVGMTEEEFNAIWGWNLNEEGQPVDADNKTYDRSNSLSAAFGETNIVTRRACFVAGSTNVVTRDYSAAFGKNNKITTPGGTTQFVCGYYNLNNSNDIFEIGNGSSSQRSNAFYVTTEGKAYVFKTTETTDADNVLTTKGFTESRYLIKPASGVNNDSIVYQTPSGYNSWKVISDTAFWSNDPRSPKAWSAMMRDSLGKSQVATPIETDSVYTIANKGYVDNLKTDVYERITDIHEKLEGKKSTYILNCGWDLEYLKTWINRGLKVENASGEDISEAISSGTFQAPIINGSFNSNSNTINPAGHLIVLKPTKENASIDNPSAETFILGATSEIFEQGDVILITQTDVPDRWYAGLWLGFYPLETTVDLTGFATTDYVNEELSAVHTRVTNLGTSVTERINNVMEVAEGKCKTYVTDVPYTLESLKNYITTSGRKVFDFNGNDISEQIISEAYDNSVFINNALDSQADEVGSEYATASDTYLICYIDSGSVPPATPSNLDFVLVNPYSDLKKGDVILLLTKEIPDRWFAGPAFGFVALETRTYEMGATNLENGSGTNAVQMKQDGTSGTFDFTNKNPHATEIDETLTGQVTYGAIGNFATVVGGKAQASGKRSMAQGTTTIAKGNYSHAEGDNSVAYGNDSHAEGYATTASGIASHSEGNNTIASGELSHAEGFSTQAIGQGSHAEGAHTIARGDYSHASGLNTEAGYNGQTVVGHCNDNKETTVFEVGCGWTDENGNVQTRKNAFEVHLDGHAEVSFVPTDNNNAIPNIGTLIELDNALNQKIDTVKGTIPTNISNGNKGGENGTNVNIQGGKDSIADYDGDFVFGTGLRNTMENQAVFGKYNDNSNWEPNRPLLMVGNGTSDAERSNAFEVYLDGHAEVKTMGETDNSIATKRYVDNSATKIYKHELYLFNNNDQPITVISTKQAPYTITDLENGIANAINMYTVENALNSGAVFYVLYYMDGNVYGEKIVGSALQAPLRTDGSIQDVVIEL